MDQIKPLELKRLLEQGKKVLLIDVRQPEEFEVGHLPGARLMPLGFLNEHLEEIKGLTQQKHDKAVVYCRAGGRSSEAQRWLAGHGVKGLLKLTGGLRAYAEEADPHLPVA